MPRKRESAKVLELRGAFKRHPERRRQDAKGSKPLNREPPAHLPQEIVPAWRYLVNELPAIDVFESDRLAIEGAARCLALVWTGSPEALKELRHWLAKLGLSPLDRRGIAPATPTDSGNPFSQT